MDENVKELIQAQLQLLRKTLIENNVSMGTNKNQLLFFDTATYLEKKEFSGFTVSIENLVK